MHVHLDRGTGTDTGFLHEGWLVVVMLVKVYEWYEADHLYRGPVKYFFRNFDT